MNNINTTGIQATLTDAIRNARTEGQHEHAHFLATLAGMLVYQAGLPCSEGLVILDGMVGAYECVRGQEPCTVRTLMWDGMVDGWHDAQEELSSLRMAETELVGYLG